MRLFCKSTVLLFLAGVSCVGQDFHPWTINGGVGPTIPMGSARDRFNTGWNFLIGAGRNFNPHVSALLEVGYNRFTLSDAALQNFNQPAGYIHFWTMSVNPRYSFHPSGPFDVYATGGYGLFVRTLAFTDPSQIQVYCDPYYGYCESSGAPVIASFTNYKGGVNFGGGFTYDLGDSLKFFTDVRYNQFLSHSNNEFITLRFGLQF